jgi:hypothetical protein
MSTIHVRCALQIPPNTFHPANVGTRRRRELLLHANRCGHNIVEVSGFKDARCLGRVGVSSKAYAGSEKKIRTALML